MKTAKKNGKPSAEAVRVALAEFGHRLRAAVGGITKAVEALAGEVEPADSAFRPHLVPCDFRDVMERLADVDDWVVDNCLRAPTGTGAAAAEYLKPLSKLLGRELD